MTASQSQLFLDVRCRNGAKSGIMKDTSQLVFTDTSGKYLLYTPADLSSIDGSEHGMIIASFRNNFLFAMNECLP